MLCTVFTQGQICQQHVVPHTLRMQVVLLKVNINPCIKYSATYEHADAVCTAAGSLQLYQKKGLTQLVEQKVQRTARMIGLISVNVVL